MFCRICREGMHDEYENNDNGGQEARTEPKAAENPLIAPCECSGSMAFVHYLCVEQWRCRSRHPEARLGMNCETCSRPYALPPPAPRPTTNVIQDQDWIDAMPPHVMAALREPHIWWRLGTAMVRRRWLRPIAPVLLSPFVSLYCKARRLLKKRGVSRRRWACSLCRRRARWKCVRCLRSYYCSRQCQNVSWHIVHKHICYKPVRLYWSIFVYGTMLLMCLPGIMKDPLVYDLLATVVPASFYLTAVLGGGVATFLKRCFALDLRGRALEFVVVAMTLWLVRVSAGLVWGFFGEIDRCNGVWASEEKTTGVLDASLSRFILSPLQQYFFVWDSALTSREYLARYFCRQQDPSVEGSRAICFAHSPVEDVNDLWDHPKCASDLRLLSWLWIAGAASLLLTDLWKKRRRHNRHRQHQD